MSSSKDLWTSGKTSLDVCAEFKMPIVESILSEGSPERVVSEVDKTLVEQSTMLLCQVSLGTVKFDCGEGPPDDEPKLA